MTTDQRRDQGLENDDARTGLSVKALTQGFSDNLFYRSAGSPRGHPQRLLHGARLHRARPPAAALDRTRRSSYYEQRVAHRLLPLGRVPARPAPGQQPAQPRHLRRGRARRCAELGLDLDELLEQEEEPASATAASAGWPPATSIRWRRCEIPAIGYGIRYEFGIFDQEIRDGWQVEITDKWLRFGNPWEIARPGDRLRRQASAATPSAYRDERGPLPRALGPATASSRASPTTRRSSATASTPPTCCGCGRPRPASPSTSQAFNVGRLLRRRRGEDRLREHHQGALPERRAGCRASSCGCEQQYFFVSCSLQDMIRIHLQRAATARRASTRSSPSSSTTPTRRIAVAELMRLLVDEHGMDWDAAWEITRSTFAYTNHTLLPEALETWPVPLFGSAAAAAPGDHLRDQPPLPRRGARRASPATTARVRAHVADRRERARRYVRMANLACVGSHAGQRRGRAAHRAAQARRAARLLTSCGRRSSATRPTASPRAASWCWPTRGLAALITERDRRRLGHATSSELRRLEPLADDAGVPASEWRAGQARRTSGRWPR